MELMYRLRRAIYAIKKLRAPSVGYCVANSLLPSILVRTPSVELREMLGLPSSETITQLNQDIFALLFNRFRQGFFIEIGANDGFTFSNTIYLENKFNWDGLLVEANPTYRESLNRRKCESVISAVMKEAGLYDFSDSGLYGGVTNLLDTTHGQQTKNSSHIKVNGAPLLSIMETSNVPKIIDFISIDVEGAEVSIVEQMCALQEYRFKCGCIEHNYRKLDYQIIVKLLKESGYKIVWEDQSQHDLFFIDNSIN